MQWLRLVPVAAVALLALAVLAAVAVARASRRHLEGRYLAGAVNERDRQIAELRRLLADRDARLRAVHQQLDGLAHRLEEVLEQPPPGPGQLRLDHEGRLIEEH